MRKVATLSELAQKWMNDPNMLISERPHPLDPYRWSVFVQTSDGN